MKRRLLVAFGAGVLAVGAVGFGYTGPASADAPDAQGWWWKAQASSSLPAALPAPPTATADGLYVASDSTGEQAVSAVRFTISEGATTGSLTLKVAGNTIGTPSVGICPITGPWEAAQNGAWDKRPAFGTSGCSAGTVAADGKSVTFTTASLVSGGLLNVAVVPVKDATGNQPTFQLSFAKPDQTALSVTAASSSSSDSYSDSSAYQPTTATTTAAAPSSSSAPVASAAPARSTATTSSPVQPAVNEQAASISPESPQGAELVPSSPRRLATRPVATKKSDNRKYQTLGIIGLALLATVYTALNNKTARTPRALVAFGQLEDDAVPQGG